MADKQISMCEEEHRSKTLFVQNLPYSATNEQLEELFSDIGPLKKCFVVKNKETGQCRGVGYVTFALVEDVLKARNAKLSLGGRKLLADLARSKATNIKQRKVLGKQDTDVAAQVELEAKTLQTVPQPKSKSKSVEQKQSLLKRGRLIIRNLSFKCEEADLRQHFNKFGEISEVCIPLLENGKKKGFGIVQFTTVSAAAVAMKQLNGTSFLDRPIAVDWAVAKDRYLQAMQQQTETGDDKSDLKPSDTDSKSVGKEKQQKKEKQAAQSDSSEDDGSDSEEEEQPKQQRQQQQRRQQEDESEQEEEMDVDDDSSDEASESKQVDSPSDDSSDASVDDDDNEDDDEDDEDEDFDSDEDSESAKKKTTKRTVKRDSDVDQGLTVFVRNLSYNTDEDKLTETMSQFGPTVYSRLVVDPDTEHPKGTAFVKFRTKQAVEKCLQAAQDSSSKDSGVIIDGRKLVVTLALPRDKAQQVVEQKKQQTEKVDGRNLQLIRESLIRPGTQAAEGLSKSDIAKRLKVETITRNKLKNPNVFVSTTRLCARNIPATIDDKQLRQAFLKAANNPHARITECRIMRDLKRVGSGGVGKSRGFAFINFTEHADAFRVLKATNNVEVFGNKKRLIVEFSLENRSALQAKEKRLERTMVKQNVLTNSEESARRKSTVVKTSTSVTANITASAPVKPPTTGNTGKIATKKGQLRVLPSHSGPKIRHKKRLVAKPEKKKPEPNVKPKRQRQKMPKSVRKRITRESTDDVDRLVQKYRAKLTSKAADWFSM